MIRQVVSRRGAVVIVAAICTLSTTVGGGVSAIEERDLRDWLTYIASDQLQGRALYSTGLGLAAAYIERHVQGWATRPAGDENSYLQVVRILGVKVTNHSSVTVDVGGETRTFMEGEGVTFPRNVGGKRRFSVDRVEFAGYGLDAPRAGHVDYRGRDVKGAAVVWLGPRGPKGVDGSRTLLGARNRYATDELRAAAVIGPPSGRGQGSAARPAAREPATGGGRGNQLPAADFTTSQRLDLPVAPAVSGSDAFFEFLFSRAPVKYADLKRDADAQESLRPFRLDGVKLTFDLDAEYEVVRTDLTHNVVAIVEGSDPVLRNSYVAFGAHYDHVGYAEGEVVETPNGLRRTGPLPGFVKRGAEYDRIWNGADDDGSGTVTMMALVKAFAEGPRPKRSLLFVWHAGEELGQYGSRFFADYPTVPIESIVAELNIDMVGRNRDDKESEANTIYLVGSDRISTELDAVSRAANQALDRPFKFDYELNDPSDPEQLYFRSDHYSYASKGIPIIFFTSGLHPDYHMNTDEVSKIEFGKMTRVARLLYETGWRVANLDHPPVRDNKGARAQ